MGRVMLKVSVGSIFIVGAFVCSAAAVRANGPDVTVIDINQGTISFEVATNVPALRIHGKSGSIDARARIASGPNGMVIEQIEATLPVRSLETGMALRDEHMRKYIFTTAGGQMPDLQFSSERAECLKSESGQKPTCTVNGTLAIRGTAKPFVMTLTVSEENGSIRASGQGVVKLSTYGIDQPSQLGVRTTDEVKLKLELTARRASLQASSMGAR